MYECIYDSYLSLSEINSMMKMKSTILFLVFYLILHKTYGQVTCPAQDDIQLNTVGFFSSGAGRVEICNCLNNDNSTCFWNTVNTGSTQPWGWKNSIVVCRELGYIDVMNPIFQNTVLSQYIASDSVSIYESIFQCDGTESTLTDCTTSPLPDAASHNNDAYITCQTSAFDGDVRLTGTTDDLTGIVEYYRDGIGWSTICSTEWDDIDARVACKSLGFDGGRATTYANNHTHRSLTLVRCRGDEISLSDCSFTLDSGCGTTDISGAVCIASTLPSGSVRLVQFEHTEYSRVEVLYNGRWGTVCGSLSWNLEDGIVACRQLFGSYDHLTIPDSEFTTFRSTSSRPIWVFGYDCTTSDHFTLESCPKENPIGYSSPCTHETDAGLLCRNSTSSTSNLDSGEIALIAVFSTLGGVLLLFFVFIFVTPKIKQKQKTLSVTNRSVVQRRPRTTAAPQEIPLKTSTASNTKKHVVSSTESQPTSLLETSTASSSSNNVSKSSKNQTTIPETLRVSSTPIAIPSSTKRQTTETSSASPIPKDVAPSFKKQSAVSAQPSEDSMKKEPSSHQDSPEGTHANLPVVYIIPSSEGNPTYQAMMLTGYHIESTHSRPTSGPECHVDAAYSTTPAAQLSDKKLSSEAKKSPKRLGTTGKNPPAIVRKSPEFSDLYTLLKKESFHWDLFGAELNVSDNFRRELAKDNAIADTRLKLEKVLKKWINSETSEVTWSNIINVLHELEFIHLAKEVDDFLREDKVVKKYTEKKDYEEYFY